MSADLEKRTFSQTQDEEISFMARTLGRLGNIGCHAEPSSTCRLGDTERRTHSGSWAVAFGCYAAPPRQAPYLAAWAKQRRCLVRGITAVSMDLLALRRKLVEQLGALRKLRAELDPRAIAGLSAPDALQSDIAASTACPCAEMLEPPPPPSRHTGRAS